MLTRPPPLRRILRLSTLSQELHHTPQFCMNKHPYPEYILLLSLLPSIVPRIISHIPTEEASISFFLYPFFLLLSTMYPTKDPNASSPLPLRRLRFVLLTASLIGLLINTIAVLYLAIRVPRANVSVCSVAFVPVCSPPFPPPPHKPTLTLHPKHTAPPLRPPLRFPYPQILLLPPHRLGCSPRSLPRHVLPVPQHR